jgi:hypothetical protein
VSTADKLSAQCGTSCRRVFINTIRQKFACFNHKTLQSYITRRSAGKAVFSSNASVVIRDPQKNFLEMVEAVQHEAGSTWWNHSTKRGSIWIPSRSWQPSSKTCLTGGFLLSYRLYS